MNNNRFYFIFLFLSIFSVQCLDNDDLAYQELLKSLSPPPPKQIQPELDKIPQPPKQATTPPMIGNYWCDPDVKLNSVRDEVMTYSNYSKLLYRHKYFLLYVTATWCDYCCQQEKELSTLKEMLKDKTIEGEEIPIIQIHSDTDLEAIKELKIGFFKVPSLYFVRDRQFIQYNSFWKADNILRFMNNIINPVVELHSVEEVEKFFDTEQNFAEKNDFLGNTIPNIPEETDHHYRIRIVAFFSDIEDYSADYAQFYSYAEKVSYRPDLRIGLVSDKEIVKHFKQIYDGIWFNSHSWNSIVLKRAEKYLFLDLSLFAEQLEVFMVYNSVPFLDELSNNNNFVTNKIVTPIALFFIDTVYITQNYHSMMKFLTNISKRYVGRYVFMYIDGNVKSKSKEQLGLKKESPLPTLVINYLKSGKQKQYPFTSPFNDLEIIKFLDENYHSKFSGTDLEDLKEKIVKSYDDKIVRNLKHTTKIEKKNVDKVVNNRKYDVMLFTVDTDYDHVSENMSKYINKICEKFKSYGIKSVLFTIYDINENGLFTYEGTIYKPGDILFFPASSKKMVKYNDRLTLLRLMKFVEHNAELRIRLPEIPHIDIDMQEEYYKRKAIIENYEENQNKDEYEIDDLLGFEFESHASLAAKEKTEL